jgi:hypothetical protein
MAAVELVREILSSDNEDWKTWAFSFATQQGDKPYTVADLLEKVVNQDKLLNAGGTKKKATALYAGHSVTQSGRHLGKKPRHNKEKGKQKKRCATKDYKNTVKVNWHKFCDACFSLRKEKSPDDDSSALDDVPASVREQNRNSKIKTFRKKMAKLGNAKREALLQQANALVAFLGDANKKTKNKKNLQIEDEEEQEAGLAELPVDMHATSDMPLSSPKPKLKKTTTAQDDELDRTLAHCTVQRFAGCSVPSNFSL